MPSLSPKSLFNARQTISSRTSSFLILTLILFFGIIVFLIPFQKLSGLSRNPIYHRVLWDHGTAPTGGGNVVVDNRHKVMAFLGIQTGFSYVGRRQSLRKTWFPSDPNEHKHLEEATGLAFRFIIGRTNDKSEMSALKREIAEYDDFIQLDIEDEYSKLSYKTLAFFKVAYALFEAEFYVTVDDDIYIRPDRLSLLLVKERSHFQTYIGCMKKGDVYTDPEDRWLVLSRLSKFYFHPFNCDLTVEITCDTRQPA